MQRLILFAAVMVLGASWGVGQILEPPGFRPRPLGVHALTGGKIVVRPGEVLKAGTVLIRDGLIVGVGTEVTIPADARVWELDGATVYAGFIEPYLVKGKGAGGSRSGGGSWGGAGGSLGITRFVGVGGDDEDAGAPGPGYEVRKVEPQHRAIDGVRGDDALGETMRKLGFGGANITPGSGIFRGQSGFVLLGKGDPNELILRPSVFQHLSLDERSGSREQYPASLMGVIALVRQTLLDGRYAQEVLEAGGGVSTRVARGWKGGLGVHNPALEALKPVLSRQQPLVIEPGSMLMVDRAGRLAREFDVHGILVASGQEWRRPELMAAAGKDFIVPVAFPSAPKLKEEDDWEEVSLEQLRAWDWAPENPRVLEEQGVRLALTTHGLPDRSSFRKQLKRALDRGWPEERALAALTTVPAEMCGVSELLGTIEAGKVANLTVVKGSYFEPRDKIEAMWVQGRHYDLMAGEKEGEEKGEKEAKEEEGEEEDEEDEEGKGEELVARQPLGDMGALRTPERLLVKGGTIWTQGSEGKIEKGAMLVRDGRIEWVGSVSELPEEAENADWVIDAEGKHISPGLVDAHSHAMILGGVNEATLPSTAMVRIADVINSETENIYLQLAGGLTVANLLHGSANPIGGQSAAIKLRYGKPPGELLFAEAPAGIKFALGENVKQSNWGNQYRQRFPQTRMGVQAFFQNRFVAGERYREDWERYRREGGQAPRRDLELEAIKDILEGEMWIHCHSYRQDEILMLLRLMEGFGVRVGTLQHVLEGYKVADEIMAHGAGASSFSDWWGYKFEVYDAIPYAGSLMHDRGVLVSFNSDDADLARRMYLEAAKAVKYGQTPEEEALSFVTLNPAKQLGVDGRVGSLEAGKDADFAVWTKSPLDSGTVCLETWIEGRQYFDRGKSGERAEGRQEEWAALVKKAKAKKEDKDKKDKDKKDKDKDKADSEEKDEGEDPDEALFWLVPLEFRHEGILRHCDDGIGGHEEVEIR